MKQPIDPNFQRDIQLDNVLLIFSYPSFHSSHPMAIQDGHDLQRALDIYSEAAAVTMGEKRGRRERAQTNGFIVVAFFFLVEAWDVRSLGS